MSSYYTRRSAASDVKPNVTHLQQPAAPAMQLGGLGKAHLQPSNVNDSNKSLLKTPLNSSPQNPEYVPPTLPKTPSPPPAPTIDPKPISQGPKPPFSDEAKEQLSKMRSEHFQKLKEARKKAGITKIDKKLKKRRLNARLEKVLKPKNAFLIFNELNLKPEYEIREHFVKGTGFNKTYTAVLMLDGQTYHGESTSIMGAKMVAADVALKDWFMKSFKKEAECAEIKMETDTVNDASQLKTEPAPWSAVGSYAMHLLFTRWQMDLSNVSIVAAPTKERCSATNNVGNSPVSNKPSKTLRVVDELVDYTPPPNVKPPPNPEQFQPLYIFNLLFPNVPFVEREDEAKVEERFQLQCKINGMVYEAKARNKKEVKRQIATQVLTHCGIICGGVMETNAQ